MNCAEVRRLVPGYLDDALPERPEIHAHMARHLERCRACREELQRYVQLSKMMSGLRYAPAPDRLGVSIRVAVALARETQGFRARIRRYKSRLRLVVENILEPLAVPATGGVLAALVVFAIMYQILGAGVPLAAATADLPTSLFQPARLEILAGFQMPGLSEPASVGKHSLLVEATVNAAGEAVSYRVLSGDVDRAMRRELDQVLIFSRFRPRMNFGRPTSGGRVILSFNKISVRG